MCLILISQLFSVQGGMVSAFLWRVTHMSSVSASMNDVREKAKNQVCGPWLETWRLGGMEMLGEMNVKV